ncbi:M20/M25/M40 family metallo-hydrolase [Pedobacter flavus]|uniref:M20/M25/M40 family metallo-hydrolase n=1 Tax=Pedobacter flavus TaxID=3113906 RepID=A0ABU7H1D7_9SPHI|nr:M20/M25/M40 family metallo-hydrolase [Pedobacter sp. VNH31]MEE1884356.1 M20/M25/M40 family metallo-hydrolase [Pedobacter sp. VNH31]
MKRIFLVAAACFTFQVGFAQDMDKIVPKSYVDNLIKTLASDDMQGRKPYTPGIDKAAKFIENEFKTIGLKPLAGEKNFRQTFNLVQIKPVSAKVTLNGKNIENEHILSLGLNAEKVNFNLASGSPVVVFDPEKPFMNQYRSYARGGKKQLVLVPTKFTEDFKRLKSTPYRSGSFFEKDMENPVGTFFILTDEKEATSYEVSSVNTASKMGDLFNVAGMIPGKSKPKEYVLFSAHYDHLGIGKAVEQDSIFNGADDDASGTTAMIALAKYYKALNNNERTLIFVGFTAEESGGYGSKYFSQQLNPEEIIAMFNIEMIGKDSKFGVNTAYITGFEKSNFGQILQKNLEGTEFKFHPDPYPSQNLFYRSDNATLAALGVPAHTISTVQIDADKLYHTVKDEYSSLDTDNIYSTIKGIAKSAISIIKGIDTPSRVPKLQN